MTNKQISEEAKQFIKQNKKLLLEQFANDKVCKSEAHPVSIFMAGSPGAGKTEFSKNLILKQAIKAVRIDADDIRTMIPQYTGNNSNQVQGASALGVEYLHDYVLKKKKSMILDATFADYNKSELNIKRSLKRDRFIEIYYIYQTPLIAWKFTKAREKLEGRKVPKPIFIDALFNSKINVQKIKEEFGDKIKVNVVIKNYQQKVEKFFLDVASIDSYIRIPYTKEALKKALKTR